MGRVTYSSIFMLLKLLCPSVPFDVVFEPIHRSSGFFVQIILFVVVSSFPQFGHML